MSSRARFLSTCLLSAFALVGLQVRADLPGARQVASSARVALEQAQSAEKADPSKKNALGVETAQAAYNAAVANLAAEIRAQVALLEAAMSPAAPSARVDAPGASQNPALVTQHQALALELLALQPPVVNGPNPVAAPEVEPNNTAATASILPLYINGPPCAVGTGSIRPAADVDFWQFTAPAGSKIWVAVDTGGTQNAGATSRDTVMDLLAADGTTVIENDDDDGTGNGGDGTVETGTASIIAGRTLVTGGVYYIRVRAFSAASIIDPYRLFAVVTNLAPLGEVEPNGTAATATRALAANPIVFSGALTAGDLDFYSIALKAGNSLFFAADGDPGRTGTGADLVVDFIGTDGTTVLLSVDSSASGSVTNPVGEGANFTVITAGTYFVRVKHFSAAGTGPYNLMLAACSGDSLCPPNPITGAVGLGGSNYPSVSGTLSNRANRDGVVSACGLAETCVAPIAAVRTFDAYEFTNPTAATLCVNVSLTVLEVANSNYMVTAVKAPFNPALPCTDNIGNSGLSSGIPPTVQSFSVDIPAGQTFVIVVFNNNATGDGNPYQLSVTGLPQCIGNVSNGGSSVVAEYCLPINNSIDPNERTQVSLCITNNNAPLANAVGTLQTTGGVAVAGPAQNYGAMPTGSTVCRTFDLQAGAVACGSTLTASVQVQDGATNVGTVAFPFIVGQLVTTFPLQEGFDGVAAPALPAGWVATQGLFSPGDPLWVTTGTLPDSAPNSAFSPDPGHFLDNYLASPTFTYGAGSTLSFRHKFGLESGFDGGVLEISNTGGASWTDFVLAGGAFTSNGPAVAISTSFGSPIAGRTAWSGTQATYVTVAANMPPALAGVPVKLRWRMASDSSVGSTGWNVDTASVKTVTPVCATGPCFVSNDALVTKVDSPDPVAGGRYLTYTVAVYNPGPGSLSNVEMKDPLPASTRFTELRVPTGWTCTAPYPGITGTISCKIPILGPNLSTPAIFGIKVQAPPVCGRTINISNTASITFQGLDINPANNAATATTLVDGGLSCFF